MVMFVMTIEIINVITVGFSNFPVQIENEKKCVFVHLHCKIPQTRILFQNVVFLFIRKKKMPHNHDNHNHGDGCSHEATDSDHTQEMGIEYSLYQKIDMENLECLNETLDGSGKGVFKAYEERMNFDKV